MPLPTSRHYRLPKGLLPNFREKLLSANFVAAISTADELLVQADVEAELVRSVAKDQAEAILARANTELKKLSTAAKLAAQREVWSEVLVEWLSFVEGLRAQRDSNAEILQMLCGQVLEKLKMDSSSSEKVQSSINGVLSRWQGVSTGELVVHTDEVEIVKNILHQKGRSDLPVRGDPTLLTGACVLRCGDFSFSTNFDKNLEAITAALHEVLQKD